MCFAPVDYHPLALRIWHRACPELNVSGEDRMVIIQATMPRFVRPKDGRPYLAADRLMASNVPSQLSPREIQDIVGLIGEDDDGNIRPELLARALL